MALKVKSWKELLTMQAPEIQYIIEPQILAPGGIAMLYGIAEGGKTVLAIDLAAALEQGERWVIYPTRKTRVLFVQCEQPELTFRRRILKYSENSNGRTPNKVFFLTDLSLKLDNLYGVNQLKNALKEYKPQVTIIDNLSNVVTGSKSEEARIALFRDQINRLRQEFHTAFIIITHPRKRPRESDSDMEFEEMSGSAILNQWADTIIKVVPDEHDKDIVTLQFQKQKDAEERIDDVRVRLNRNTLRYDLY